ncbi:hydroxymethylbilane synthase [Malassezia equina]|uniref:hydroxymethylbilane synthase n=1 Tax=Malassezia equina TaxID=1381935 RepID=A0AAF0EFQ3_9BASI|nr:hydroxymethylbilane synthase [Malassezia equina]
MASSAEEVAADEAQCPVPHAKNTPLPPGHPKVQSVPTSKLRPPEGEHCIFFRTREDTPSSMPEPTSTIGSTALTPPLSPSELEHSLVISSRKSALAVCQAKQVQLMLEVRYGASSPALAPDADPDRDSDVAQIRALLRKHQPGPEPLRPIEFPARTMSTQGDNNLRAPLYVIGGEGRAIWTKELEVALVAGSVDAIVHSLKDVPTTLPEGLELAAILEREDPRDALVVKADLPYKSLKDMPRGSVIGTSSVRRVALLRRAFPHLMFSDVRGNIQTRLAKLDAEDGPYTALVLAAAGLKRMNLEERITAYVAGPVMLHAVGQGSLGIEVRTPRGPMSKRDERVRELIQSISCWRATWRCAAERALMHRMEGGCSIPLGVATEFEDHNDVEGQCNERLETPSELASCGVAKPPMASHAPKQPPAEGLYLTMSAIIVSLDGLQSCEHTEKRLCRTVKDAEQLGIDVADHLEHHQNARAILEEVEHHRRLAEAADQKRREGQLPTATEVDRRFLPRDDGQPKVWEV